nr:bifunctional precorrin-2 dehydrogenase/sirohydrochlorin ferrochelatase [Desulfobacterales bacterium]
MRYYPINLDVRDRKCVVVGGGPVGERKVKMLLECGASVMVVSPDASEWLRDMADQERIDLRLRKYRREDLEGAFLVIGATNDAKLNQEISRDAARVNILCNIVDQPEACNFVIPAVFRQGDLLITISTSGKSPAFARKLREQMEKEFGPEYGTFLEIMGAVRKKLLGEERHLDDHRAKFEKLIEAGLLDFVRSRNIRAIDALLLKVLGEGYTCESLGITKKRDESWA